MLLLQKMFHQIQRVVLGEVIVIAHEPTLDTHYYSKNSDGKWIVFNNGKFELSEVQFEE